MKQIRRTFLNKVHTSEEKELLIKLAMDYWYYVTHEPYGSKYAN